MCAVQAEIAVHTEMHGGALHPSESKTVGVVFRATARGEYLVSIKCCRQMITYVALILLVAKSLLPFAESSGMGWANSPTRVARLALGK